MNISLFEALGGAEAALRLGHAWHQQVMAAEIVAHAFRHGFHPQHMAQHMKRLAAYWGEAPHASPTYSERFGNGSHKEMDRRASECTDTNPHPQFSNYAIPK